MIDSLREQLQAALDTSYTLERELGCGGMATVYLARDLRHNREVAMKVLFADVARTAGAERFLREVRIAASLVHPHILPLLDSGEANGIPWYTMPVMTGATLRDRIDAGPVPVDDAVRWTREVAEALDHAHRQGVVHRDVKPENIMLHEGHALVCDFGIGKAAANGDGSTLTHGGLGIGTPAYVSPEQAVGEEVDGRSDQYSLACTLYELLVGEPPFTGRTTQAVIAKRFVQTPADVMALREGVRRPVALALQRALSRTPIDRFESCADFARALAAAEPVAARVAAPAASVAVLPFENLGAEGAGVYFGDGIADEVIGVLGRIPALKVVGRTSSFAFRGTQVDLRTIGEQLGVATVLEGSVRTVGSRIRVTAQLVSAADGYRLWSERYDRELVDLFAVQDEIARSIAERLAVTFAPAATPAAPTPAAVRAYELCVQGRALAAKRGAMVLQARSCFEEAIALAPEYAPAHAGLGEALRLLAQYNHGPAARIIPLAKAALERALALDPTLAMAHGTLAHITLIQDLDRPGALVHWERALALAPALAEVRALRAVWGLIVTGTDADLATGCAELDRALADDPLSSFVCSSAAMGKYLAGRRDEAHVLLPQAIALDPSNFVAHFVQLWCVTWDGDFPRALALAEDIVAGFGRHPWVLSVLPAIYRGRGDHDRAQAIYDELRARARTSFVPYFALSQAAAYIGRLDEAIDLAFLSVQQRDAIAPFWRRTPFRDPYLAHPRYPELVAAMGV